MLAGSTGRFNGGKEKQVEAANANLRLTSQRHRGNLVDIRVQSAYGNH